MASAIKKISDKAKADLLAMGWLFEKLKDGDPGISLYSDSQGRILKLSVDRMYPPGGHPLDDISGLYLEIYSGREPTGYLNPKDCIHRGSFNFNLDPIFLQKNLNNVVRSLLLELKRWTPPPLQHETNTLDPLDEFGQATSFTLEDFADIQNLIALAMESLGDKHGIDEIHILPESNHHFKAFVFYIKDETASNLNRNHQIFNFLKLTLNKIKGDSASISVEFDSKENVLKKFGTYSKRMARLP